MLAVQPANGRDEQQGHGVEIHDLEGMLNVSNAVCTWTPLDQDVEFDEVVQTSLDSFSHPKQDRFSIPYHSGVTWFLLELDNKQDTTMHLVLELTNPLINQVDFYVSSEQGLQHSRTGEFYPFEDRTLKTSFATCDLHLKPNEHQKVFIRIDNYGNIAPFQVRLGTYGTYLDTQTSLQFGNALYYGMIVLLLIINIYLLFIVRERVTVNYLIFIASVGALQFIRDGYMIEHWFSETRSFNQVAINLAIILSMVFNLRFFSLYFDLQRYMPRINRSIWWLIAGFLVLIPLSFWHDSNIYILQYNRVVITLVATLVLIMSIYLLKKQGRKAQLYLAGYSIFYLGICITFMVIQSWITDEFLRNYCLKMASAIEISILTFALVYNNQTQRRELNELALKRLEKINALGEKSRKELEKKIELSEELKRAQMKVLRTQMNPHFIFNSLNAIHNQVLSKNSAEASAYLTKFSQLMRKTLENSMTQTIPLEDDVNALELYLSLEQFRFDNSFDYSIDVDERLFEDEVHVPALLLQPFVENAIWHGIQHRDTHGGKVSVNLKLHQDLLHCTIEDNGKGRAYAEEMKNSVLNDHKSHGVALTAKRLGMLFEGEDYPIRYIDLTDATGNGCGTRVEFELPLM